MDRDVYGNRHKGVLCGGFGLRILILPHVIDGAGTFAHVKAGGEGAR